MNNQELPGARILVVDDKPNITDLIATALRSQGFEVQTAGSGRNAIVEAHGGRVCLENRTGSRCPVLCGFQAAGFSGFSQLKLMYGTAGTVCIKAQQPKGD
jgi:CheY-like chemotaxis protein